MQQTLFIGVMTGTSADGIDICLSSIHNNKIDLVDFISINFPDPIKSEIKSLCIPGENELARAQELGIELSLITADHINNLLLKNKIPPSEVSAIGYHGQTVRHQPKAKHPFSVQIGCGSTLAHITKIKTVTDFRMADIAAGGQGAPLVPAFHKAAFYSHSEHRVIINIGGIANITHIPCNLSKDIIGFDTGPGNTLLDEWIGIHQNKHFDDNGNWAKSGTFIPKLFALMMEDNYIKSDYPKSTGKEYFNIHWLNSLLKELAPAKPEDIQRTLLEFTSESIFKHALSLLEEHKDNSSAIYLCGGGINNSFLVERLQSRFSDLKIKSTLDLGIHPQLVEASAFAWLASRTASGIAGNLKSVTGASQDKILGCIYFP